MRVPTGGYLSQQQQQQIRPITATGASTASQNNDNNRRIRSRRRQFFADMSAGTVTTTATGTTTTTTTTTTPRPSSTSPAPASASGSSSSTQPDLPSFLHDPVLNRTYARGRYLGKGGFAWCYEVTDVRNHNIFALKVVPKTKVVKQRHRAKVLREISIHHPLRHQHVVRLYSAFEDDNNIYMVLELCQLDSLVAVMKKRKTLTECETRYYMMQLLTGVQYLHDDARVLHRDLKLGNMLLTDQMQVKIADFGLASEMGRDGCDHFGQVCGTPNYISPEVLRKEGHSSASEAWAIGCIMYAMLVGKPPFETHALDATYALILACQYSYPPHARLSSAARDLIRLFLHPNPGTRPTPAEAMAHEFFAAPIPITLPVESCHTTPNMAHFAYLTGGAHSKTIHATTVTSHIRNDVLPSSQMVVVRTTATATYRSSTPFDIMENANRLGNLLVKPQQSATTMRAMTPLTSNPTTAASQGSSQQNVATSSSYAHHHQHPQVLAIPASSMVNPYPMSQPMVNAYPISSQSIPTYGGNGSGGGGQGNPYSGVCSLDSLGNVTFGHARENALTQWLYEMFHALNETIYYSQAYRSGTPTSTAVTMSNNVLYVTKWIDYSNRYGFGCQLNNGGVSIMQNDRTRLCLSTDRRYCRRWHSDRSTNGCVSGSDVLDMWNPPSAAQDSLDVVRHFVDYMDANLVTGGFSDALAPLTLAVPFIVLWRRFSEYLLIILSDGTFQINFISLHTKVVLTRVPMSTNPSKFEVALTYIDETRLARTCPLSSSIGQVIDGQLLQRVRDLLGDYVLTPGECMTAEI